MPTSRGDTIVEVLLAMAIAGFAIGISYATANRSLQQGITAGEHNEALNIIENQATNLKLRFLNTDAADFNSNFASKNHFCLDSTAADPTASSWAPIFNYQGTGGVTESSPLSANASPTSTSPYNTGCTETKTGEGAVYYYDIMTIPNNSGATVNATLYQIVVRWERLGGGQNNQASIFYKLNNDPSQVVTNPPPVNPPNTCAEALLPNLVLNPDFSQAPAFNPATGVPAGYTNPATAKFTTKLPYRGYNPYLVDDYGVYSGSGGNTPDWFTGWSGGYGLMSGYMLRFYYSPYTGGIGYLEQYPFPGDTNSADWPYDATGKQVKVGAVNTWWYSNPVQSIDQPKGWSGYTGPEGIGSFTGTIWEQDNIRTLPNSTYIFSVYFDNLYAIGQPLSESPLISLDINGNEIFSDRVVGNQTEPKDPNHPWQYFKYIYTTGPTETSVNIKVVDNEGQVRLDDYAMTHIGFYKCQ